MRSFGAWAHGPPGASGESCNWGDGGGGSGASTGESGSNPRKLVADELAGWIGRQEQVVKELKQHQEQANEQIRQTLDCSLARHERTLERLLAWYLQPHKDAPPVQKAFSTTSPAHTPVASTLTGEPEYASSTLVEEISGAKAAAENFAQPPAEKRDTWVSDITDFCGADSAKQLAPNRGSVGSRCSTSSRASTTQRKKPKLSAESLGTENLFEGLEHVKRSSLQELTAQAAADLQAIKAEQNQSSTQNSLEPSPPGQVLPLPNSPPSGAPTNLRPSVLVIPTQAKDQSARKSRTSISPVVSVIPQFKQQMRASNRSRNSQASKASKKSRKNSTGRLAEEEDEDESEESSGESGDLSEGHDRTRRLSKFSAWEAEVRGRAKSIHEEGFGDTLTRKMSMEKHERSLLSWMVRSNYFDYFSALLLASNAILIGFQVEQRLSSLSDDTPSAYEVCNTVYGFLFLVELTMRMGADGIRKYFLGHGWTWNWFDFIVVSLQVIEIIAAMAVLEEGGAVPKYLVLGRLVRVARIVRVVRVIRVMRFFKAFRILLTMIFGTMKNGVWATLLLVLIMYIFAIVFTQSLSDHLIDLGPEHVRSDPEYSDLMFYYGSMPRAILTLFKSIIGGVDWEVVLLPLAKVGWVMGLLFLGYISFVQLAVMNVVTGLFLQSAIEQAQSDQEHVIQLRLAEKQNFVDRLHSLFHELDSSHDGSISLSEFESHLRNEHMQAMLQTFEIDNADAWTLFKLLDSDGGGSVDIDEFVDGCIRLKGGAKSIQMAQMMYQLKWIMDKLTDLSNTVMKELKPMAANQGVLATYIANLSAELHKVVDGEEESEEEDMVEQEEEG